ncbi:MAG: hypothetical protein JOZ87_30620 [Chloroflexi bacterium]|nr:hypothetical protein [Chloroflexota bacterium]
MSAPVADRVSDAMREFLVWVAFRPRTYADTMEAWGSHCPRFTQWEDALELGLITVDAGLPETSRVCLTEPGRRAIYTR